MCKKQKRCVVQQFYVLPTVHLMVSRDDFSLLQFYYRVLHSLIYMSENCDLWSHVLLGVSYEESGEKKQQSQDAQEKNNNICKWSSSGKDGLLSPLLGEDSARLVLGFWVIGQLGRAGGHGAFQDGLFQVVEHSRVFFGQEGHRHTTLSCTTRSANTMDIVWES